MERSRSARPATTGMSATPPLALAPSANCAFETDLPQALYFGVSSAQDARAWRNGRRSGLEEHLSHHAARPGAHWMGPPYRTATRHAIAPTQMRRSRAAIDVDPAGGSRAIATREAPASESERVDERLKRRGLMTSAWIVQEVAVERRAPVLEDPHEPTARYVFGRVLLEQESQSQSVQRSTERERGVAEDEGPRHGHSDGLAPLLELPSIDAPAGAESVGEAAVRRQVPRRFRLRV